MRVEQYNNYSFGAGIAEARALVLFLKNVDEWNFIHSVVLDKVRVSVLEYILGIFNAYHLEGLLQVAHGHSLDAKYIVTLENGKEVLLLHKRLIELVDVLVHWVILWLILKLDATKCLKNVRAGILGPLLKHIGH